MLGYYDSLVLCIDLPLVNQVLIHIRVLFGQVMQFAWVLCKVKKFPVAIATKTVVDRLSLPITVH